MIIEQKHKQPMEGKGIPIGYWKDKKRTLTKIKNLSVFNCKIYGYIAKDC